VQHDIEQLKKFYNVETLEELIQEQAQHVEKLQQSVRILDKTSNPFHYRSPREG
jgi:hypothetical protein